MQMNKGNKLALTRTQFILLIHGTQMATGILYLPQQLAAVAGSDGWISLIFGWMYSCIIGYAIIYVMALYEGKTFGQILQMFFGRWLGKLALLAFALLYAYMAFFSLLNAASMINVWALSYTPSYHFVFLLMVPVYILARKGIQAIGRYAEFVFFFILGLPFLLVFALKNNCNILYFLPVLQDGWGPVLNATVEMATAFSGLEIAYFLYPYLEDKKKAASSIFIANAISGFFLLFVTIVCFLYMTPDNLKINVWPTLSLLKGIQFAFLERLEIIFLSLYLFQFSTNYIPALYVAASSISNIFTFISYRKALVALLVIIFGVFLTVPMTLEVKMLLEKLTGQVYFYLFAIVPMFLWVYGAIFHKIKGGKAR
ncbi:GerAB/ArcD/ProY family transporter [Priestia taiwanensis]|nr:endospore germination permease [Priestia taiwanensis]